MITEDEPAIIREDTQAIGMFLASEARRHASIDSLRTAALLHGFSGELLSKTLADPVIENSIRAIVSLRARLTTYEELLEYHLELWKQRDGSVAIYDGPISRDQLITEHYMKNLPAVIRNGASSMPAVGKWTPEYLAATFGDIELRHYVGTDPYFHFENERQRSKIHDFVANMGAKMQSNELWLFAGRTDFRETERSRLVADIALPAFCPDTDIDDPHSVVLLINPKGSVTRFHYDPIDVIFVHIYGKKRFLITPSFAIHRTRHEPGLHLHSLKDPLADYLGDNTMPWVDFTVDPGDLVFIPLGWWHWVQTLETSISVNFINMRVGGRSHDLRASKW